MSPPSWGFAHVLPAGMPERAAGHTAGFGFTVGGAVVGHCGLLLRTSGELHRFPEHTRTTLQSGLKSSPYSQTRSGFEQSPSLGSVAGQSGLLGLPLLPLLVPPDVALLPSFVEPEQALNVSAARPSMRAAKRSEDRAFIRAA